MAFHEDVDPLMDPVVLEGAEHFETGTVPDVGQARIAMPAEVPLVDLPLGRSVEDRPPFFELPDPAGGVLGMELGHAPGIEEFPSPHGIAEMHLPVVPGIHIPQGSGHTAFGHDRMGLSQEGFADQSGPFIVRGSLDSGPQTSPSGSDNDDIVFVRLQFRYIHRIFVFLFTLPSRSRCSDR